MVESQQSWLRRTPAWLSTVLVFLDWSGQTLAKEPAGDLRLTEEALAQYDGSTADKPIYLAINGTIFDVSNSPSFYGPGGHYHHFVGKDASRAWVSECWDSEAQLTWRMDGLEAMYMPKYLDEQMQQAANGESDIEGAAEYGHEELARMAKVMMGTFGKVSEKEMLRRKTADREEAKQSVRDRLAHWVQFFANNEKYRAVGEVVLDSDKPAPPELCREALKKRPHRGGGLDDILSKAGGAGGIFGGGKRPGGMGGAGTKQKEATVQDEL